MSPSMGGATGIDEPFGFAGEAPHDDHNLRSPAAWGRGLEPPPSTSSRAQQLRMRLRAHAGTPRDSKHVHKLLRSARLHRDSEAEKKVVADALAKYKPPPFLLVTGTPAGTMQQLLLKAHKLAAAQEAASHKVRGGRAKARRRRGSASSRGSRSSHGSRSSSRSGSSRSRRQTRIFKRRASSRSKSRLHEVKG